MKNNSSCIKAQILVLKEGGTRYALSFTKFKKLRMKIPPTLPEQQKIADCLSSLDELIELQTKKIELLKKHKKA